MAKNKTFSEALEDVNKAFSKLSTEIKKAFCFDKKPKVIAEFEIMGYHDMGVSYIKRDIIQSNCFCKCDLSLDPDTVFLGKKLGRAEKYKIIRVEV